MADESAPSKGKKTTKDDDASHSSREESKTLQGVTTGAGLTRAKAVRVEKPQGRVVPRVKAVRPSKVGPAKRRVHARGIAGRPKVVKQTVESYARDTKALQLCQAGLTYDQINDQLQYGSRQNAHRAVKRRLDELHRECSLTAVELREKQLGEVATTKRAAHAVMGSKDSTSKEKLLAIAQLHNAIKLEASLCGTFAPTRNELTGRDGAPLLEMNLTDLKSMTDDQIKRALSASLRSGSSNGAGAGDAGAAPNAGRSSPREH